MDPDQTAPEQSDQDSYCLLPLQKWSGVDLHICRRHSKQKDGERSGSVLDTRPRGRGFESHRGHCIVSLSKNINPSLVLVQPRKTSPFITERLLMGRKESDQTNKNKGHFQDKKILAG